MRKKIQLAVMAFLVLIDQIIKYTVLQTLPGKPSVMVIPGLLQLTYVENRGAAWGMFAGQDWLLVGVTTIVLAGVLYFLLRGKFDGHPLLSWCITGVLSGGFGNLIDRIYRGFVVDYLDIGPLFSFPVFNLADSILVVSTALLIVYYFFIEPKQQQRLAAEREIVEEAEIGVAEEVGEPFPAEKGNLSEEISEENRHG